METQHKTAKVLAASAEEKEALKSKSEKLTRDLQTAKFILQKERKRMAELQEKYDEAQRLMEEAAERENAAHSRSASLDARVGELSAKLSEEEERAAVFARRWREATSDTVLAEKLKELTTRDSAGEEAQMAVLSSRASEAEGRAGELERLLRQARQELASLRASLEQQVAERVGQARREIEEVRRAASDAQRLADARAAEWERERGELMKRTEGAEEERSAAEEAAATAKAQLTELRLQSQAKARADAASISELEGKLREVRRGECAHVTGDAWGALSAGRWRTVGGDLAVHAGRAVGAW